MVIVHLSLGSNIGNRKKAITQALELLHATGEIKKKSRMYETEPVGKTDQPFFLNICVEIETTLRPIELLSACQKIENDLGRVRHEKWGPRTLDIDILLYDDRVVKTPSLTIPHPLLHERRFVLVPLAEIAPDFVHPALKKTIAELLKECADNSTVKRYL